MKRYTIGKNDCGQRVDKFLSKTVPGLPQSHMYKQIRKKRIKLNGKRCLPSELLRENDILELYVSDDFFGCAAPDVCFKNAPKKLAVIYEDENIIIADKKPGLPVHDMAGVPVSSDTLINRIKRYLYDKGEYDPDAENSFAPALCNRIDRNTGGMVIAAKNALALRIINEKIRRREIEKKYLCVTVGSPPEAHGIITAYIEKDGETNTVKVTDKKTALNKTAVTEYKVIRESGRLALLEITLHTGRTHQIRAHMAHINCPVLGDGKYGAERINREYKVNTQALYSYKLRFDFKTDGGILNELNGKEFTAPKVWFLDMFD
jgi:23S rRNA pseudouridine955/2504/2580 synthase